MIHVDLGCGNKKPPGAIGIDSSRSSDADIITDLSAGIPLPDNHANYVSSNHFLEHIAIWPPLLWETWRVLKPGGVMTLRVPYAQSQAAIDPAHRSIITEYWLRHCWEMHAHFTGMEFEFEYDEELLGWARQQLPEAPNHVLRRLFWNVCRHMRFTAVALKPKLSRPDAEQAKVEVIARGLT